jgi:hypothetical protein
MADDGVRNRANGAAATSSVRMAASPLRRRPLSRSATIADMSSPMARRSNSFLTVDSTEVRSLRSSTDDLLLPRVARHSDDDAQHETSHLQSAPLALALLPAVGGLFFHNGSAILTDATLLILAAIFLNWSVRLPWYAVELGAQLHNLTLQQALVPLGTINTPQRFSRRI